MNEVVNPIQVLTEGAKALAITPETKNAPVAAPTLEPEKPPAKEERVSGKLQTLVRREKLALEREKSAKTKEAELEAKLQGLSSREAKLQEFENLKASNPLKALELLGLSYQDLTTIALNDGQIPPEQQVKKVEEKFDNFLKSQEQAKLDQAEAAKTLSAQQEAQVTQDFKSEIGTFLSANATKYQFIKFEMQEDLVYDVIDTHYENTIDPKTGIGKILTIQEAADKVETFLEKKYDDALKLEKVQSKLQPQQSKPGTKPQERSSQKSQGLTNTLSATSSKPRTSPMTDEERVAKAIAYARGLRT